MDPVATQARLELDRIRRRLGELPLAAAQAGMPAAHRTLAALAALGAPQGATAPTVPDLGPAIVPDQLTVLVWDAYAAGRGDGIPALLADLRRALG